MPPSPACMLLGKQGSFQSCCGFRSIFGHPYHTKQVCGPSSTPASGKSNGRSVFLRLFSGTKWLISLCVCVDKRLCLKVLEQNISVQDDDCLLKTFIDLGDHCPKFLRSQLENIIELSLKVWLPINIWVLMLLVCVSCR